VLVSNGAVGDGGTVLVSTASGVVGAAVNGGAGTEGAGTHGAEGSLGPFSGHGGEYCTSTDVDSKALEGETVSGTIR
jgi:hypothetical protein